MPILKIGTRSSPLALFQARRVKSELAHAHELPLDDIEIVPITTSGDKIQDKSLALAGGKGLFTKEIEEALISGVVDLAVHSMKDVPTVSQEGLKIACVLEREDARDAFICLKADSLTTLPEGSVVGTASLRRQAQLKHQRPDLDVVPFRGNVDTRLRKLEEGVVDATLLAVAGLNRLNMKGQITEYLPLDTFLPAVAQGAIGIEIKEDNVKAGEMLVPLNHEDTFIATAAERAFLRIMDGSCRTPIAAYGHIKEDMLSLRGQILMPDGSESYELSISGDKTHALDTGEKLGRRLREEAGEGFMVDVENLSKSSY